MDDHGIDGEIEEVKEKPAADKGYCEKDLSSKRGMALSCDVSDRQHTYSDHQPHQNNGDHRSSGHYLSNLDKYNNNRHSKKHRHKDSSRAHNHIHRSTQQHSRQNAQNSTEDEDPLSKSPTVIETDSGHFHGKSVRWPEKAVTEDGEILEDGELDDDKEAPESQQMYADKDHMEASASKSSSKQVKKGGKGERKRSRNRGKRNHENDTKMKSYAEVGDFQDEKDQKQSWGSGYHMSNPREQGYKRGSKGGQSLSALYDSPPEDLDNELVAKTLLTGGYLDASVAATEKQGLFGKNVSLGGKTKKRKYEKNERKRGQNAESSFEGPPKKKTLLDMQMSERPACKFYLEGKCAKGGMCPFNHDVEKPKKMEVCKYHLTFKGCVRQTCQFMHQDFPCKYYHTGGKCFSGDRCKFSHDPLTEATRKALELRVAAEDIINMEDQGNNSEQRLRDANNKPSLLGSPPQLRTDLKKIPSLLDIEVHMPGQSSKASPQIVRPSGFYNDTTETPAPGPINSVGLMKNAIASNQHSQLSNQGGNGGAGLLPLPVRPGFVGGNIMGSQQGLNSQHQRFGLGASVPMKNPQLPQNGHMSPVLNMLGAIIREAASQKGPDSQCNMMPKASMGVGSMSPSLNNGNHNQMAVESVASNTNNCGSMNTDFIKTEINVATYGKMAPVENFSQDKDIKPDVKILNQIISSSKTASSAQHNVLGLSCKTEPDETSQRNFDDMEESQDICELDKIRQQIQAQIDEEEQKEVAEDEEQKSQLQEKSADSQEAEGLSTCNTVLEKKANIEVPTHLPKTQQELFKRIQQQQLLRETELDKQKTCTTAEESEAKDVDDWYSSDEEGETKPKLTDVLKKLNQEPSLHASGSSAVETHNSNPPLPSAASTFNIMQMINAIKVQSQLPKPAIVKTETSVQPLKLSLPQDSLQGPDTAMSPASPPLTVSTTIMKSFGILRNLSNCQPPPLAMDPPVINAVPMKPLSYLAVRISLEMPKPYAELLDSIIAADPAFKDDPRVKWHLSYIEKQPPKEPQSESSSEERSQKQSDPHLTEQTDSNSSDKIEGARPSDPRLHRTEPQSLPADPRLARLANGNLDPRLNRQIIQNQNGSDILNIRGGAMPANIMNMGNQVGSFINGPTNNMASMQNTRASIGNMTGHFIGQLGGNVGNFNVESHRLVQDGRGSPNMTESMGNNVNLMGRPMNKMGGEMSPMQLLRAPQMPSFALGGNRMMLSQENTLEDPLCLPNQLHTDPSPFVFGLHNSSDPRFSGHKVLNEMHGNTDPRLRHRSIGPLDQQQRFMDPRNQQQRFMDPRNQQQRFMDPRNQQQRFMDPRNQQQRFMDPRNQQQRFMDPRDQQQRSMDLRDEQQRSMDLKDQRFNMDSGLFRMSPNSDDISSAIEGPVNQITPMHANNLKPFTHVLQQQREVSQSLNIEQKAQGDGLLPYPSSVASSMPPSDTDVRSLPRLDHRSDPRFKRVKKVAGQQKDGMEYSSPSDDDKCVDTPRGNGQSSSAQNSCNRSRSGYGTGAGAAPSPPLPGTLRDFSHRASPALNVAEPFVPVKHLFKTIDPTASPFC